MPDGDGLTACERIKWDRPESRVLVLTSVADDQTVLSLIQAGADGYILKDVVGVDISSAVEKIAAGGSLLDPITTRRVMGQMRGSSPGPTAHSLKNLSAQELRVLAEVAQGRTDKEAAETLHLSSKTVRNYLDNIFTKLGVNRRSQAAVLFSEWQAGLKKP